MSRRWNEDEFPVVPEVGVTVALHATPRRPLASTRAKGKCMRNDRSKTKWLTLTPPPSVVPRAPLGTVKRTSDLLGPDPHLAPTTLLRRSDDAELAYLVRYWCANHAQLQVPAPPGPHHCSSQCPMIRHHQHYLCRISGNVHTCGEVDCNAKHRRDDHMECSITARRFGLHMKESLDRVMQRSKVNGYTYEEVDYRGASSMGNALKQYFSAAAAKPQPVEEEEPVATETPTLFPACLGGFSSLSGGVEVSPATRPRPPTPPHPAKPKKPKPKRVRRKRGPPLPRESKRRERRRKHRASIPAVVPRLSRTSPSSSDELKNSKVWGSDIPLRSMSWREFVEKRRARDVAMLTTAQRRKMDKVEMTRISSRRLLAAEMARKFHVGDFVLPTDVAYYLG